MQCLRVLVMSAHECTLQKLLDSLIKEASQSYFEGILLCLQSTFRNIHFIRASAPNSTECPDSDLTSSRILIMLGGGGEQL